MTGHDRIGRAKTGACADCGVATSWRMAFCAKCYQRIPTAQRAERTAAVFNARRRPTRREREDALLTDVGQRYGAAVAELSPAALAALTFAVQSVMGSRS